MSTPWISTLAPGSARPIASTTRPETVPEGVWADAEPAKRAIAAMLAQTAFLNTINVSFTTLTDTRHAVYPKSVHLATRKIQKPNASNPWAPTQMARQRLSVPSLTIGWSGTERRGKRD